MLVASLQFAFLTVVILIAGSRLSRYGDVIAERSGLGRTWIGVILVASVTAVPELATGISSVTVVGSPDIAVGDVLGSCMFNLLILALLDVGRRSAPLATRAHSGHIITAAAGALLLAIAVLAMVAVKVVPSVGWIGLSTPVLVVIYLLAMRTIFRVERERSASEEAREPKYAAMMLSKAVKLYTVFAVVIIAAAAFLPHVGTRMAELSGLGETLVGNLFIGMSTSLPELVVSLAAMRIGAVDLAYGNLLGSNLFNLIILAIDDIAYTSGPLLEAASPTHAVAALTAMAMSAVIIIALVVRSKRRIATMAWESLVILMLYALSVALLFTMRTPAGELAL